jgi:MFS transporter, MFS domain-containing protein family, molybdate-anion transporter
VYALYESYGFSRRDIAAFFVVGFASSALFGTFIGSLADSLGRRKMAIAFGIFYSLSCLTKLSRSYYILMIGRLLAGISTSLLFSVFESWMVYEHHKRMFSDELLSSTFALSTLGNSVIAIISGFLASGAAYAMGFVGPFMVATAILVSSSIIIFISWGENYGDSTMQLQESIQKAVSTVKNDSRIILLGIVQSLFEASMYVFVFMWTPVLAADAAEFTEENSGVHGIVFSGFMLAIMLGSSIFSILISKFNVQRIQQYLLIAAAAIMLVPVFFKSAEVNLFAFMLFEICCGIYFPTQGTLRSFIVPEESRSTIMNFFRVPLNILVVLILLFSDKLSNSFVFLMCSAWLILAAAAQFRLNATPAAPRHDANNDSETPLTTISAH